MARFAFQLRLRPDTIEEYEKAHQQVWPELLAKIKEAGISHYSIFRRGVDLFLVLEVADFDPRVGASRQGPRKPALAERDGPFLRTHRRSCSGPTLCHDEGSVLPGVNRTRNTAGKHRLTMR